MPDRIEAFRIRGFIGREPMAVEWSRGYLSGDPELLDRADTLVGDGAERTVDGVPDVVRAGLDGPWAALLTLLRCFDRITDVDLNAAGTQQELAHWVQTASPVEVGVVRVAATGAMAQAAGPA